MTNKSMVEIVRDFESNPNLKKRCGLCKLFFEIKNIARKYCPICTGGVP